MAAGLCPGSSGADWKLCLQRAAPASGWPTLIMLGLFWGAASGLGVKRAAENAFEILCLQIPQAGNWVQSQHLGQTEGEAKRAPQTDLRV